MNDQEPMTPEQERLFIWVARMGWACGLSHPYEWLTNVHMHAGNLFTYDDLASELQKIDEAFVAFMKAAPSCLEEAEEPLTRDRLWSVIDTWYAQCRHQLFVEGRQE